MTTTQTKSESGTEAREVRCKTAITEGRREHDSGWQPETVFEVVEDAHDQVRAALEEMAGDNPDVAVGLLLHAAADIGQAVGELTEEHDASFTPPEERSRHIGKLVAADPNLAALAEKACYGGPNAEGAMDRALALLEGLQALSHTSARLEQASEEARRVPIRQSARQLVREVAVAMEEARDDSHRAIVNRDYALAVLSGDPDDYAASRGDNPPIKLDGGEGR